MNEREAAMAVGISWHSFYDIRRTYNRSLHKPKTKNRLKLSGDAYVKLKDKAIGKNELAKSLNISYNTLLLMIREYEKTNNIKDSVILHYNLKKEKYIDFYNRNIIVNMLKAAIERLEPNKESSIKKKKYEKSNHNIKEDNKMKDDGAVKAKINTTDNKKVFDLLGSKSKPETNIIDSREVFDLADEKSKEPIHSSDDNDNIVKVKRVIKDNNSEDKKRTTAPTDLHPILTKDLFPLLNSNNIDLAFVKNEKVLYNLILFHPNQLYEMISLGIINENVLNKRVLEVASKLPEHGSGLFIAVEV